VTHQSHEPAQNKLGSNSTISALASAAVGRIGSAVEASRGSGDLTGCDSGVVTVVADKLARVWSAKKHSGTALSPASKPEQFPSSPSTCQSVLNAYEVYTPRDRYTVSPSAIIALEDEIAITSVDNLDGKTTVHMSPATGTRQLRLPVQES